MTRYVGVKGWGVGDILPELKRAALLCDSVILRHIHGENDCKKYPETIQAIEKLQELGIVVRGPDALYNVEKHEWLRSYPPEMVTDPYEVVRMRYVANSYSASPSDVESFKRTYLEEASDIYARVAALQLQDEGVTAVALLNRPATQGPLLPTKRGDVVRIVLDKIPMPDAATPWEAILDWRSDPEAHGRFAGLRCWINQAVKSDDPMDELKDQLEAQLEKYSTYMWVQHQRLQRGRFEIFCSALVQVLEGLPKIKLSPLLDVVFHAERSRVALAEEELKAPHRELAYIIATRGRLEKPRRPTKRLQRTADAAR